MAEGDPLTAHSVVDNCMTFNRELWAFFHVSACRLDKLHEMQAARNDPRYSLIEPSDTRWLSCHRALDSVCRDIVNLSAALKAIDEKDACPRAELRDLFWKPYPRAVGLRNVLHRPYTVACLFMMRQATEILNCFSKRLQTRRLTLLHLSQEKQHYISKLKDVVNVASAVDCYQCSLKDPDHECVCPEQFPKGQHPEFTLPDLHYQAVWPAKWQEVTGLVDDRRCLADWPSFRREMANGMQDGSFTDVDTFLAWFFERGYDELYGELTKLLVISAVLPLSSCSVERVFSAMKRIKTRLRNRLKDANVRWLIFGTMEGPDWTNDAVTDLTDDQAVCIIKMFEFEMGKRRGICMA
eukprot:gene57487-biopygen16726